MATFKICVFKHQKRRDGKYPVSIRVYWKYQYSYINTEYYTTDKQVKKSGKKGIELKDPFILKQLNERITRYENLKSKELGDKIGRYTAKELAEFFEKHGDPGENTQIDFVQFSREYIGKLIESGRVSTAKLLETSLNALIDFTKGREKLYIHEITAKNLADFETFLRSERTLERKNQFGKIVTTKKKGLSDVGIHDYMTNIRILFNAAMAEFNDEDKGDMRITHYPFRKYKIKRAPESRKRNLSIGQIRAIRDMADTGVSRTDLARDVFMLSFYLIGANLVDLYFAKKLDYISSRFTYERRKTKDRRQDNAFISVNVEPEAYALIEKHRDPSGENLFNFAARYSDPHNFQSNVNKGLKKVASLLEIAEPLSTYYARHSWATIARNDCNISKDDINLALNHVDEGMKVTDIYIAKDWSRLDRANRVVLDHLGDIGELL